MDADATQLVVQMAELIARDGHEEVELQMLVLVWENPDTTRSVVVETCHRRDITKSTEMLMLCCHFLALTYYHVFNDNQLFLMHRDFSMKIGVLDDLYEDLDADGTTDLIRHNHVFPRR